MRRFVIYTDGGAVGNPGPAAAGAVFCNEKEEVIKRYSKFLGENLTNNEAEYKAAIFGLKKFKALFGKKLAKRAEIELRSDSKLLVNQITGKWKIKEPKIQPLFLKLWNLILDFGEIKFKLISREENKKADHLVQKALRAKSQKLI